jgi:DNA modification methylase
MSHQSEQTRVLEVESVHLTSSEHMPLGADVNLLWLPSQASKDATQTLAEDVLNWSHDLSAHAVVCVLTSPEIAARILPVLETGLQYQLWVAIKTPRVLGADGFPRQHAALLVFTRNLGSLKHTKTRIAYSYCPACGKTTKDYGGKKHVYHQYGTLMSDVWRDVEVDPSRDVSVVVDRLRDVFGLEPHRRLRVFDLHELDLGMEAGPVVIQGENPPIRLESRLINGDSLEVLATLPDHSVDFVFADPPYNLDKHYDRWDDALEAQEYLRWCDRWLSELNRVLKPGGTLAVLNIPQLAARHFLHLDSIMQFQMWIAWEGLSLPVRMIMPAHYGIACFSKGEARALPGLLDPQIPKPLEESFCLRASCVGKRNRIRSTDRGVLSDLWWDVHRLKHNTYRVDHPCQLPPILMERLIALFTQPGEVVLDPFNGAATTTLVAARMNRRFIGIELSEKYHQIASQRHMELEFGIDPFGKGKKPSASKNSRVKRLLQRGTVSKKALQLEVKRVALEIGHVPSKAEVAQFGRYSLEHYDGVFISWAEACAAARTTGMSESPIQEHPRGAKASQDALFDF